MAVSFSDLTHDCQCFKSLKGKYNYYKIKTWIQNNGKHSVLTLTFPCDKHVLIETKPHKT